MGATPDQVHSIAIMLAFRELWQQHPRTYEVRPTYDDVQAALPQIVLKAFAADMRDNGFGPRVRTRQVLGELTGPGGLQPSITVGLALNKIIHGIPSKVEVLETGIWLTFNKARPTPQDNWTEARYSGTDMLRVLRESAMSRDEERRAVARPRSARRPSTSRRRSFPAQTTNHASPRQGWPPRPDGAHPYRHDTRADVRVLEGVCGSCVRPGEMIQSFDPIAV